MRVKQIQTHAIPSPPKEACKKDWQSRSSVMQVVFQTAASFSIHQGDNEDFPDEVINPFLQSGLTNLHRHICFFVPLPEFQSVLAQPKPNRFKSCTKDNSLSFFFLPAQRHGCTRCFCSRRQAAVPRRGGSLHTRQVFDVLAILAQSLQMNEGQELTHGTTYKIKMNVHQFKSAHIKKENKRNRGKSHSEMAVCCCRKAGGSSSRSRDVTGSRDLVHAHCRAVSGNAQLHEQVHYLAVHLLDTIILNLTENTTQEKSEKGKKGNKDFTFTNLNVSRELREAQFEMELLQHEGKKEQCSPNCCTEHGTEVTTPSFTRRPVLDLLHDKGRRSHPMPLKSCKNKLPQCELVSLAPSSAGQRGNRCFSQNAKACRKFAAEFKDSLNLHFIGELRVNDNHRASLSRMGDLQPQFFTMEKGLQPIQKLSRIPQILRSCTYPLPGDHGGASSEAPS
ncbi:hypothetical protein Anapl_10123 [Anas platyrhynchos]|uniref:Uncharacterized protein n=1 Tax=Anas platyrhynchos TaxID=8839 RepID=R0JZU7_ANAPL|nr:hypothetical protein Anapl_10123 [Anas platyrhynchos]